MRAVIGLAGFGVAAAFSLTVPAKGQPCVPAPCASIDECKRGADWVVVGRVLEYNEGGIDQSCHVTLPFLDEKCGFATRPPTVLLDEAVQLRGGAVLAGQGVATLPAQASCYAGPLASGALPGSGVAGQRFIFYGNDARPGSGPGFVIAEPLEAAPPTP